MRYRLECPANRYIFKSHLNCSESTAGSLRQSGSEFQTVGPATEKARVPRSSTQTTAARAVLQFLQKCCKILSIWRLKCPVTTEFIGAITNKLIYLSIYLSIVWQSWADMSASHSSYTVNPVMLNISVTTSLWHDSVVELERQRLDVFVPYAGILWLWW